MTPATVASLQTGATQNFTAVVNMSDGSTDAAGVTWTITPATGAGSITQGGVYTAPSTARATAITVTATSKTDTSVKGTATISAITAPAPTVTAVTVTGPSGAASPLATLAPSATYQLSAAVTGTNSPAQTVTWTATPTANGQVSATGLFTAAASGATGKTTITATSTVDNTKKGTFEITAIA